MRSFYFQTQEEARQWAATHKNGFTLRRVNLEDAFLALTGKKIQ
jgi:ABC-2 type transport system ATP-binding protein